ncbi:MAG TPA: hypothetical protein VLI90_16645 [Tepidisphaeraceae bacterium]|nr:hypothetical protein [Tepidisphaeraceae bacterium]
MADPFVVGSVIAFVGPDRLNRRAPRGGRQIDPHALPLLRFCSLQRLQAVLRNPRQPAFGPSRFDVSHSPRSPPEVGTRCEAMTVVLAVLLPCVLRAPGPRRAMNFTIHTGPVRVIAPRSLFRAAFRYPIFTRPFHDWAECVRATL